MGYIPHSCYLIAIAVTCSSNIHAKTGRVGYDVGLDADSLRNCPITSGQSPLRQAASLNLDKRQFHALLSMVEFKAMTKDAMWEKPAFFFSDCLEMNEAEMNEDVSRWVRKVEGQHYFLPPCFR